MSDVVITITGQDNASSALRNVQRAVASLGDGVAQATQRVSTLGSMLQGVAQGVGFALANVAAGGVAALGSSLANSVNAAGAFEAALLKFRAVAGDALTATGASLKDVEQLALQLGSSTSYSAQEALDALTELVKGGVSVADAMGGATEATLNLASAAQLDLANAAEIVAKQLGVWGDTGITAANVADLLASAANASTVDVGELALGLANVGGSAKVAGLSFEETVQALALIAPAFQSASDAGTSLKTFIASLVPQTKDATKAMIELGLATEDGKSKFFDAQGEFIGMEQAAALLQNALRGLSEEQKITALNTIFGSDAIRAATMIAESGASGFTAMGQAMAATGGAAASAAQSQQGYNYALQELAGAWETLQIVLGSIALPMLTDAANRMRDGIAAVTEFVQAVQGGADPLLLLAQQLGLTGQQAEALRAGVDAAGAGVTAALTLLQSTAQAALSAISAWWRQHGDEVLATAQTAWTTIQQAVGAALGALQSVIAAVIGAIGALWQRYGAELTAAAQTAWSDIQRIVTAALGIIQSIISATMSAIGAFWQAHGQTIIAGAQAAWQAIAAIVEGALRLIAGIIGGALAAIRGIMEGINAALRGDWQGAWNAIVSATTDVIGRIGNAISSGGPMVLNAVDAIGQAIQDAWNGFVGSAAEMGAELIDGITSGVQRAAGALASSVADAAWRALEEAKRALGISSPSRVAMEQVGKPIAQGIAGGLQANIGMVAQAGRAVAQASLAEPRQVSTTVTVGGITVQPFAGMNEQMLAQRIRAELETLIRTARAGG